VTLVVQTDEGTAVGANSYLDVVGFKAYHDDRGNDYSTYSDAQIGAALIRATDYLDDRFDFIGYKYTGIDQPTEWPRADAWTSDDFCAEGIPVAVVEATAEYALRSLAAPLAPDPTRGGTGGVIKSISERVEGAVSRSVEYVDGSETYGMPDYPLADAKLYRAGLVRCELSGDVERA